MNPTKYLRGRKDKFQEPLQHREVSRILFFLSMSSYPLTFLFGNCAKGGEILSKLPFSEPIYRGEILSISLYKRGSNNTKGRYLYQTLHIKGDRDKYRLIGFVGLNLFSVPTTNIYMP